MLRRRQPDANELIAAMPIAMLVVDDAGRIATANAECEFLLNQSERAMLGERIETLLPLPFGGERDPLQAIAAYDVATATSRGLRMRIDVSEAMLPEHPGWRIVTLQGSAASRRLGQGSERAAARAAVGAAAMLAHEIKNPLSGIRGAAQLIADGAEPGELTTLIISEVDRVAALIDRMQDFTDTRPLSLEPLNIYPLLTHARDVARAGFAREIAIDERFDPSLPDALGNRDALLQIVLNLLRNAAFAVGDAGTGRITLATAYRHGLSISAGAGRPARPLPIEISVIDTGPGAPEDIAGHLFDPFVSGRPEGTGLGLALVDKLVRDMGGIVQYAREGTPPVTIFRFLLPRAPS